MRGLRFIALVLIPAALLILPATNSTTQSEKLAADQANVAKTTDSTWTSGSVDLEGVAETDTTTFTFSTKEDPAAAKLGGPIGPCTQPPVAQAPANGFDDETNGFIPQGKPLVECAEPVPGDFLNDKAVFEEVDEVGDGLGPVYNAQSCKECHQNPVTGAISQTTELRAGHTTNNTFFDAPGGSLINNRGIPTPNYNDAHKSAKVQERVPPLYTAGIIGNGPPITREEETRTFRTSLNTLGDGFVEAVADGTLISLSNQQRGQTNQEVHGLVINVPVLEANFKTNPGCIDPTKPCVKRVGRFGWKNQHASLVSFSGDAYLNEIGITNFLVLDENTSLGRFVGFGTIFDIKPDDTLCDDGSGDVCGEDEERDVEVFAEFMRATQAPPQDRDIQTDIRFAAAVDEGRQLFESMNGQYSCSVCHVPSMMTANRCQPINGGEFHVPLELARKIFHPFGDFLLHDIGTGDGIVQNGGPITRLKVRTAPLWGLRTRTNMMHDGTTFTFRDAILRHGGEAAAVRARFQALTEPQKIKLFTFLETL